MPTHNKLVAFDRPLVGAVLPGRNGRLYTEAEVAAERNKAYQEGTDSARGFANQQLVEFRAEVQALQEGLFARLADTEKDVVAQLQSALPILVVDIARRLLAGFEPGAEQLRALCEEALNQVFPEQENLELHVSTKDAVQLDSLSPDWKKRYPGLKVVSDASLSSGDCQVHSRFGLTDATRKVKLDTLARELLSA